ncbi:hypothetical protein, partial [Kitasatospora sp. MBT63]
TTNQSVGEPIKVGKSPFAVTLTPWADHLLVTNIDDDTVTAIDTATNRPTGDPIPTGDAPYGAAVTWTGNLYVANAEANTVTATRLPSSLHQSPKGIAVSPDGTRAYTT